MDIHLETKFEIKSWDEVPFRELPGGQKLARASVQLVGSGPDNATEADLSMLLHYRADGTSTYLSLMAVEGTVGERSGSFALSGTGSYDGTQARGEFSVVPGSGTGDFAGVQGTGTSLSTHADYPYLPLTLDCRLG